MDGVRRGDRPDRAAILSVRAVGHAAGLMWGCWGVWIARTVGRSPSSAARSHPTGCSTCSPGRGGTPTRSVMTCAATSWRPSATSGGVGGRRDRRCEEGRPPRSACSDNTRARPADRELAGRGVLTYAAPRGHALIDRALYLPKSWCDDPDRCDGAGIPGGDRVFATKPALAQELIERAVHARYPPDGWPATRSTAPTRPCGPRSASTGWATSWRSRPTGACPPLPARSGSTTSPPSYRAGPGSSIGRAGQQGPAPLLVGLDRAEPRGRRDPGCHHLLIRRNDRTGELAYLRCYRPTRSLLLASRARRRMRSLRAGDADQISRSMRTACARR